jgi:hypothetical protein
MRAKNKIYFGFSNFVFIKGLRSETEGYFVDMYECEAKQSTEY